MAADGRRARGDQSRQKITRRAAELASMIGLEGLSLGMLAQDLGISKSNIAALYRSKQDLQLATIAAAVEIFVSEVVEPASLAPRGLQRLLTLVDAWFDYVSRPVFPGGCFMVATASEFDSQPGAVRDALAKCRHDWLGLLTQQITIAQANSTLTGLPPHLIAFEIDAILSAANIAANLFDDPEAFDNARRLIRHRLTTNPA